MGELLYDSTNVTEILQTSSPILPLRDPISTSFDFVETADLDDKTSWETVSGLEDRQRRYLQKLHSNGVMWKHPDGDSFPPMIFRLSHGGDVDADGNCLFTASKKAMGSAIDARELRRRTVARFLKDLGSEGGLDRGSIDATIKHLYTPDLRSGWGINVVQEVKLLAKKVDRDDLDKAISELVDLGLQRDAAAESIYKGRCFPVDDSLNWAKYMSISGSPDDEYDIISLQYTEEGLLTVDDNREGHAAAFGDDIAIEFLATEFMREIYVVQAHGSDAMVDDENCVFFLPHRPRSRICEYPFFLFMKGTGWCGAGADHYEPLIAHPAPLISEEKAAVIL